MSYSLTQQTQTLLVRDFAGTYVPANAEDILAAARRVIQDKYRRGVDLSSPTAVREYLTVLLGAYEHEVFTVLFLDAHFRLIACREMFRGTVSQTSVYPREVVKEALQHNAAAIMCAHNHPSGNPEPSQADQMITNTLRTALSLVDVRLLDHIIVAGNQSLSFSERGLL
ncbi:DNA repair protein RadC [Variovorax boronicumulans]|uniref:DNA repair protein RadC n=1 Tax=Variovorax boronicumulans TaxID=436515 RepID=A0AAW8D9S5_9BURK|nr:DNA repair protein RadC [Variovorax boronicumulans]MDP9897398.1 DNA repair protein RadC [Variovorax boronicumulans]MDQ0057460.1 DNA repair protein RadC [Variovorax boronicumulans]